MNRRYDLTAGGTEDSEACTGIIAQDEAGNIFHGRNLDYGLGDAMRAITLTLDWSRNGSVLFTSVSLLGQTGFDTVVRHNGWGLTQDERDVRGRAASKRARGSWGSSYSVDGPRHRRGVPRGYSVDGSRRRRGVPRGYSVDKSRHRRGVPRGYSVEGAGSPESGGDASK